MRDVPKVAIVHDWLVGGGAEKVVLELHQMFPDAPIYTSYCKPEWQEKLDGKVVTGYLQRWPFSALRKFLPLLRGRWFRKLDLSGFDLIISSKGNGEANYVRTPEGTMHICYCHTPTHFYWRHYEDYLKRPGFGVFNPLARLGLKVLVGPLRRKDYAAAQHVDHFIANSSHIQSDIKKFYGRESVVIHPPVDTERFESKGSPKKRGFVTIGRLVPYKRTDIIVETCNELKLPLTVVGRGPELSNLQKIAGTTVTFDADASDEAVVKYMQNAEAFLFAAHEDFGVTPVEAMAAGTPVIAYKAGGSLDTVTKETGIFFDKQITASLKRALQKFQKKKFDRSAIIKQANQFSHGVFQLQVREFVNEKLEERSKS